MRDVDLFTWTHPDGTRYHFRDDDCYTKEEVNNLIQDIPVGSLVTIGAVSAPLNWTDSGSGYWYETVTVTGVAISADSKVDFQATAAQLIALAGDGVKALYIENNNGTLTTYSVGAAPTSAMTIQVTVTETGVSGVPVIGEELTVPEVPYKPGDTLTLNSFAPFDGLITSSTKSVRFLVPTPKSMANITTITATKLSAELRGAKGYLNSQSGYYDYADRSGYTVTCTKVTDTLFRVNIDKSSAFSNVDNNTPVSANLESTTVFEFS